MTYLNIDYKAAAEAKRRLNNNIAQQLAKLREQALESPGKKFTLITPNGIYSVTKVTEDMLLAKGLTKDDTHMLGVLDTSGSMGSWKMGDEYHSFFQTYKPLTKRSPAIPPQAPAA